MLWENWNRQKFQLLVETAGGDLKLKPLTNNSERKAWALLSLKEFETIYYLPSLGMDSLLFLMVHWLQSLEIQLVLV